MPKKVKKWEEVFEKGEEQVKYGTRRLTPRQNKFIDLYAGNAREAARLAGYKNPQGSAEQLMRSPKVIAALKERNKITEQSAAAQYIMSRVERQMFWTKVVQDESIRIQHRLKASELLARSEGDFVERRELTGPGAQPLSLKVEVVFVDNKQESK